MNINSCHAACIIVITCKVAIIDFVKKTAVILVTFLSFSIKKRDRDKESYVKSYCIFLLKAVKMRLKLLSCCLDQHHIQVSTTDYFQSSCWLYKGMIIAPYERNGCWKFVSPGFHLPKTKVGR